MIMFRVEKVDHNDDGTTTVYGTTTDGWPVVRTFQPDETVLIQRPDA